MRSLRTAGIAAALLCVSPAVHAQHVSLWAGGGLGTFLTGGAGDPNAHRLTILALALPADRFELRLLKGTFERSHGIPANVGDDDLDYRGFDVLITRRATHLPVDLAIGAARYEETYHYGYPHQDLGGQMFVHRWGPHVSAARSLTFGRFFQVWAESDLHYAPYQPSQLVLFVDIGIGLRF